MSGAGEQICASCAVWEHTGGGAGRCWSIARPDVDALRGPDGSSSADATDTCPMWEAKIAWEAPEGAGIVRTLFRPGEPGCHGLLIADTKGSAFPKAVRAQQARLMAASPELLEALIGLMKHATAFPGVLAPCPRVDAAFAAIAKAEGRAP